MVKIGGDIGDMVLLDWRLGRHADDVLDLAATIQQRLGAFAGGTTELRPALPDHGRRLERLAQQIEAARADVVEVRLALMRADHPYARDLLRHVDNHWLIGVADSVPASVIGAVDDVRDIGAAVARARRINIGAGVAQMWGRAGAALPALSRVDDVLRSPAVVRGLGVAKGFSEVGGNVLGVAGVIIDGRDTVEHLLDEEYGEAAVSASKVALGIVAVVATGPVALVAGGVLVTVAVVENWDAITDVADDVGRRAQEGVGWVVDGARGLLEGLF